MFRRMIDWFRRKRAWHRQWHLSWPPAIQPDAEGLTPFQRSCIARLTQSLPPDHQPLVWERLGSKETYLKTSVPGTSLICWVYEDGAEVSGPGLDRRLESADYSNPDQLVNDLVSIFAQHARW